jgi:hypothetical protein
MWVNTVHLVSSSAEASIGDQTLASRRRINQIHTVPLEISRAARQNLTHQSPKRIACAARKGDPVSLRSICTSYRVEDMCCAQSHSNSL